jgi:hypothetical protein
LTIGGILDNRGAGSAYTEQRRAIGAQGGLPFSTAPPPLTSSPDNRAKYNIDVVEASAESFARDVEPGGSKSIGGVIREIKRDTVRIDCILPSGIVEMQIPPTLVPPALMQVGQPIAISLDTAGGYRHPVLRARPIAHQPKLPGQEEFEKWVDSL